MMAIGGSRARVDRQGLTGPLLTSSPDLPYTFAPPDDDTIAEFAIVWLVTMGLQMLCQSAISLFNIPIG